MKKLTLLLVALALLLACAPNLGPHKAPEAPEGCDMKFIAFGSGARKSYERLEQWILENYQSVRVVEITTTSLGSEVVFYCAEQYDLRRPPHPLPRRRLGMR